MEGDGDGASTMLAELPSVTSSTSMVRH
eukprot:SAG11_NODE_14104_length_625_cov_0.718631_1_plen_27_part_10